MIPRILKKIQSLSPLSHNLLVKNRRIVKFITSGGIAALVNLLTLLVLAEVFHVWYLSAAVVGFVLSVEATFVLQKFWTFRVPSEEYMGRQLTLLLLNALVNLVLNICLLYALVEWLHVWYLISQAIIMAVLAVMNFNVYKFIIFKK